MSVLSALKKVASSSLVHKAESEVREIGETAIKKGEGLVQSARNELGELGEDAFDALRSMRVTGKFREVPHEQLKLKADFSDTARVEQLEKSGGFEHVSLNDLPLDQKYVVGSDRGPNAAIPNTWMQHQSPVGFTFDAKDQETSEWMPQAVTTTADADPKTGLVDGKKWVAVSWHSDKGDRSRISLVDYTHPEQADARKYRNVELMVPDAAHPGKLAPLASHVGGMSWVGNYLYVAQTGGGVRVFDVNQLLKVTDQSKVPSGTAPYVLPQVGYYRSQMAPGEKPHAGSGSAPLFSGLSIDRTGKTPALLSQEYDDKNPGGRIIRWPIDPQTGRLSETDGTVQATNAWAVPLKRLAGIVRLKDGFRVATMGTPSGLWSMQDGQRPKATDSLAVGIQQFSYDGLADRIWTVAEHPGHRMVWQFKP